MKCRYKKSAYVPGQSVLATTCCTRRNVISLSQKKRKYLHHHSQQEIVTHAPTCLAVQFDLQTCLLDIFNDMFGAQFFDTWRLVKTPSPFKLFFSRVIVFSSYCLHSRTPKRNGMQQSFWHVADFPRLPPDVLFVLWAHSSRFETNRMFKRCCSSLWWYDRRLAGIQRCRHFPRHDNVVRCRIVEMNFIQYRWEIFSLLIGYATSLTACMLARTLRANANQELASHSVAWEESSTHLSHCQSDSSDPTHIVCCSEGHERMMDCGTRLTPGSGARVLWSRRPQV